MKLVIACTVLLAAALAVPAEGKEACTDDVWALVEGDRIRVFHEGALYNCCPTGFDYDVSVQNNALLVVENEILDQPCFCTCCIDLEVEIGGVSPGEYSLLFVWYDYETTRWRDWLLEIVVPGVWQSRADPFVASKSFSECYTPTSGVTRESPSISWTTIKEKYR